MNIARVCHDRSMTLLALATLAVAGAVLWAAYVLLDPTPPRTVVMTTGPEGSAYQEFARRYREILARDGIELRLRPSNGSGDNLDRLRDPQSGAHAGFVLGGATSEQESPQLASLGTLFYEPVWLFYRGFEPGARGEGLLGRRISMGLEGSGTRAMASKLLALNGINESAVVLLSLSPLEASQALLQGRIDVAVMASPWDTPIVQQLIASEAVEVLSFPRADAYVALLPYLSRLVLPEGVGDMATNRPPTDVLLVSPKASLVVQKDLHPAIQYLLLEAAAQIHSGPGIFRGAGQFPGAESVDLPLSAPARQYYKSGSPLLQRYLPFWMAVLVVQGLVILIPFFAVVYPVLRVAPLLYDWRVRGRIYKLYGELKFLDADLDRRERKESVDDLVAQLDGLETRAHQIKVPMFWSHYLYTLRQHIWLVRERLERWQAERRNPQHPGKGPSDSHG